MGGVRGPERFFQRSKETGHLSLNSDGRDGEDDNDHHNAGDDHQSS